MPLDFAYRVHTDIGHSYAGAKVNGNIVKMNYELKNNDSVEILINKNPSGPKPKWLDYVKTSNARDKIRSWLRKKNPEENVRIGREIAERHLRLLTNITPEAFVAKFSSEEQQLFLRTLGYGDAVSTLEALGDGSLTIEKGYDLLKRSAPELYAKIEELSVHQQKKESTVTKPFSQDVKVMVGGDPSLQSSLAKCCNPRPADQIVGYLTKKKGIVVHRIDCMNIVGRSEGDKFIPAQWRDSAMQEHPLLLVLRVKRQPNVLRDLTYEIANSGYGVTNITAQEKDEEESEVRVKLLVRDLAGIQRLYKTLASLDYVASVARA
jgi:GTP pyrophosphokinase